jgi:uncharacterized membrane protein
MRRAVAAVVCSFAFQLGCEPDPTGIVSPSTHGGGGEASSSEPTWCNVQRVLEQKCQRCHQDPPMNGAPFPLVTYEDTQVSERTGRRRYERIYGAVESEYMPATFIKLNPPVQPLTDDERSILLEWAAAGGELTGGDACD